MELQLFRPNVSATLHPLHPRRRIDLHCAYGAGGGAGEVEGGLKLKLSVMKRVPICDVGRQSLIPR